MYVTDIILTKLILIYVIAILLSITIVTIVAVSAAIAPYFFGNANAHFVATSAAGAVAAPPPFCG